MTHNQSTIKQEPTIIPIESLEALEREFWELTRDNNKEFAFITDGKNREEVGISNERSVRIQLNKIEWFVLDSQSTEFRFYHTHPHRDEEGKGVTRIYPPNYQDLYINSIIERTIRDETEKRFNMLNLPIVAPLRPTLAVIEKYGIWEYRPKKRHENSMYASTFNYKILECIDENSDKPIEDQVRAMKKFYKTELDETISFRKF